MRASVSDPIPDAPEARKLLPITVTPITEGDTEAFDSWIDRLCHTGQFSIATLLDYLEIDHDGRYTFWGVTDDPRLTTPLAANTGAALSSVRQTLLERWDGIAFSLPTGTPSEVGPSRTAAQKWAFARRTRACFHCLAENGGVWDLSWRTGYAAVCPEHHVVLADTCPGCHRNLKSGTPKKGMLWGPSRIPCPTLCSNPPALGETKHGKAKNRAVPCEFDFTTAARSHYTVGGPNGFAALRAQKIINGVLHGTLNPRLNGIVVPAPDWFDAIRDMCTLIAAYANPGDLGVIGWLEDEWANFVHDRDRARGKGDAAPNYQTPPPTAAQATAVLPLAVKAVNRDLDDTIALLVDRAAAKNKARWRFTPDLYDLSPAVRTAWEEAVTPHLNFARLSGPAVRDDGTDFDFDADHIPAYAPVHWWEPLAGFLPGTAETTGRTFVSICMARMVEGCSWKEAVVALGVDEHRGMRIVDVCVRRVTDAAAFWDSVRHIAHTMPKRWPDYGWRRYAYADWAGFTPEAWKALCAKERVHPGRGDARRRNASAYAWSLVVGSHPYSSPALVNAEHDKVATRDSLREVYRRFTDWLTPSFAAEVWLAGDAAMHASANTSERRPS